MKTLIIGTPNLNRYAYRTSQKIKPVINLLNGGFDTSFENQINIVKTTYVPKKGDKIYFAPAVTVPRVKFKNVCAEHKIKTVRSFAEADLIVASKKTMDAITNNHWYYKVNTEKFKDFCNIHSELFDEYDFEKLITHLEYYTEENVALDYNLRDWMRNLYSEDIGNDYSEKLLTLIEDYDDLYETMKIGNIIDENTIITMLNGEDASVIDSTMYEHLKDMFESSDTDNHVLAMEIMANSMYKESLVYLELLFYKYSYLMISLPSRSHVNFKSLLSYLDKIITNGTTIDVIARSLMDKDEFTEKNLNILLEETSEHIQSRGDTEFFRVKQITLSTEAAEALNKSYVFQTMPDFNPKVIEEEVIIEEPESEFAMADNIEYEIEAETDSIELDEILVKQDLDTPKQESVLDEELILETESNNNQTNTNDESDIEWF